MADVVIVVGTKRGNEKVPALEIKQMIGRAGRKHGGEACQAYIITDDDCEELKSDIEQGSNLVVCSSFLTVDDLVFHLMPEISSGRIRNTDDAERWFSRSLAATQGSRIDFRKLFDKMEKIGAVQKRPHGVVAPTRDGEIAAALYFHPADVRAWRENFARLFELGLEHDTAAIAWALGGLPVSHSQGDFGTHRFVLEEFRSALPLGLDVLPGRMIRTVLWWGMMGGPPMGQMRNQMLELRGDFGRVKRALLRMDQESGWGRSEFFDDVQVMVDRHVGCHLV